MSKTISSNLSLGSFRLFFSKPFVGYLVLPLPSYEATLLLDLLLSIIYFQGVVGSIVMGFLSYSSIIFQCLWEEIRYSLLLSTTFSKCSLLEAQFFPSICSGKGGKFNWTNRIVYPSDICESRCYYLEAPMLHFLYYHVSLQKEKR